MNGTMTTILMPYLNDLIIHYVWRNEETTKMVDFPLVKNFHLKIKIIFLKYKSTNMHMNLYHILNASISISTNRH